MVFTPTDMSPEPDKLNDLNVNENKVSLVGSASRRGCFQGDGVISEHPAPVPMLRLNAQVLPAGFGFTGEIKQINIERVGNMIPSDVIAMELYTDENGNGIFDGQTQLGIQNGQDAYLASGTFNSGNNRWEFQNLDTKDAVNVNGNLGKKYTIFLQHGPDLTSCACASLPRHHARHLGIEVDRRQQYHSHRGQHRGHRFQ